MKMHSQEFAKEHNLTINIVYVKWPRWFYEEGSVVRLIKTSRMLFHEFLMPPTLDRIILQDSD